MHINLQKYTIFIILTLCFSQTWQPFHKEEILKYTNYNFNYNIIDKNALSENVGLISRDSLTHKIVGYLPYWEYENYPSLNYNLLTEINFFSAELNQYGDIINSHNWENLSIVDYAHDRGVKVKLCATLFDSSDLTILLADSSYRANAINNLLNMVVIKNADGIDIDFEGMPSSQRFNLVLFMLELSAAFHQQLSDPIITMATPAIDWSDAWDYNALAEITDGLFIMGYNYFYSSSSSAGPVSPLGGYYYDLEYTINDYIEKTNGNVGKLILGLPYYGYDWPVVDNSMNSLTSGSGVARIYSEVESMVYNYGYNYNIGSQSPWFQYTNNTSWQQCWYDNNISLSEKYTYAKQMGLSGIGIWALGYDTGYSDLWEVLSDSFYYGMIGDANGDLIINVIDIITIINAILNDDVYSLSSDLNNDNDITILDIIILVNIILELY